MSDEKPKDTKNSREGRFPCPGPLYAEWLQRAHREDTDPNQALWTWMRRALDRDRPLMSEFTHAAIEFDGEQEEVTDAT